MKYIVEGLHEVVFKEMSWTKEKGAALERLYRTAKSGIDAVMNANSLAGAANTAITNPGAFVASTGTPYLAGAGIVANVKGLYDNGKAAIQGVGKTIDNARRMYNRHKAGNYEDNKDYAGTKYDQDHYKLSNQAKQKVGEIVKDQAKLRVLGALSQGVTDPTSHKFYNTMGGIIGGGGNNFSKLGNTLADHISANQAARIASMTSNTRL